MRASIFVVADSVEAYDAGKLVMVGVFEVVVTPGVPSQMRPFALAMKLIVDKDEVGKEYHMKLTLAKKPRGKSKPVFTEEVPVKLSESRYPGVPSSAIAVVNLAGVRFPEFGEYAITLKEGRRTIAETPLYVVKRPAK